MSREKRLDASRRPRGLRTGLAALAVVAVLLSSAVVLYDLSLHPAAESPVSGHRSPSGGTNGRFSVSSASLAPASSSSGVKLASAPASGPVASGRGAFFNNANLSAVRPSNRSCFPTLSLFSTGTCPNATFDPSVNVTSGGTIGVAFTAFTNYSHCAKVFNLTNNTMVDVGFQSSTNGGATWSSVQYLGNENCSEAANLTDAWQPSLTSLANGTFVLTYAEFNVSRCTVIFFLCSDPVVPRIFPYDMENSALVVQESYNGGSTWTAPQVLNQTFNASAEEDLCGLAVGSPLYHPWISASGTSVYLVYENISDANGCLSTNPYSAGVHLISSTDGGATWGAPVNFPTVGDGGVPVGGLPSNFSVNPYVLAAPNGQVYVAYATGLSGPLTFCEASGCTGGTDTQDVVVANATGGNGTWTVHYAATNEPFDMTSGSGGYGASPFVGIHPQLAYDGVAGQLDLVYSSEAIGSFCTPSAVGPPTCQAGLAVDSTVFQNSSNGGATWSQPEEVGNLTDPYNGTLSPEYYPAIAVDPNGTVAVTSQLFNDSSCGAVSGTPYCGAYEQVYFNSTDNGASWNGPVVLSAFPTVALDSAYMGEYETATTAPSGAMYFAWTNSACPLASGGPVCRFANPAFVEPNTTVVISWMFAGAGVSLTLHETNLTASYNWSADILGNERNAPAGTDLVVSGVPTTEPIAWAVGWLNLSYGVAWQPVPSATNPLPPATFPSSMTLDFTFQEFVEVTVNLNPPIPPLNLTPGLSKSTYQMAPLPGTFWVGVNTPFRLVVAPQSISCVINCTYDNLTWVSWTGIGIGSFSTNATNVTFTVGSSPVQETANFIDNGNCVGMLGVLSCVGPYAYPLTFFETGLPAGTAWGVTVTANGTAQGTHSATATIPWLNVTTGQNAAQYTVWTVPAVTGSEWIPTSTPGSPVKEPTQTLVNVTYTLANPAMTTFVANFSASGLPNGTAWTADVGSTSFAVTNGSLPLTVTGGARYTLNGSFVYTEEGVAYYAASVSVLEYMENTTWVNTTNFTAPNSPVAYFNGSASVVIGYLPMFWLTVTASTGGIVSPASRWVESGANVTINATALPKFRFLEWTGAGAGSSTALQEHDAATTISPTAPVTELATFRPDPLPVWNVTVTGVGLPSGVALTFTLGTTSRTGSGASLTVGGVPNGSYRFLPATVYANASNGTRWVPKSWISSFGPAVGGMLNITADGTVTVSYETEYVLTVASGAGGSVTPSTALGSTWAASGSVVELTASPAYHYAFTGWNASGPGTVSATTVAVTVTVLGPTWETATFAYREFPPAAVFSLGVTESGLPKGLAWSVSVAGGTTSAAGPRTTLNLSGLNGTSVLVVPAVYLEPGIRYVANGSNPIPVTVEADGTVDITFTEQFVFVVTASVGGTVTGVGRSWVATGDRVTLSAIPAAGYQFVGWNGSGNGGANPYTGPDAGGFVVVSGPTNETATFVPAPAPSMHGAANAGELPALGLLIALLVVGLTLGAVVGSRWRRGPPNSGDSPAESEAEERDDPAPGGP